MLEKKQTKKIEEILTEIDLDMWKRKKRIRQIS